MSLKYQTLVYGINNLGDARYCAGMGVDILIFNLDPQSDDSISWTELAGISGWLSGIVMGIDAGKHFDLSEEDTHLLSEVHFQLIKSTKEKAVFEPLLWVYVEDYGPGTLLGFEGKIILVSRLPETRIGDFSEQVTEVCKNHPVFIGFGLEKEYLKNVFELYKPEGFALRAQGQLRPGYNDFGELADILEFMETE